MNPIPCTIPGLLCTRCGALKKCNGVGVIYSQTCLFCASRMKVVYLPIDYFEGDENLKMLTKEDIVEILI